MTKSYIHPNLTMSCAKHVAIYTNLVNYTAWQFLRIMLALCSMLLLPYYAQNYAGIIGLKPT